MPFNISGTAAAPSGRGVRCAHERRHLPSLGGCLLRRRAGHPRRLTERRRHHPGDHSSSVLGIGPRAHSQCSLPAPPWRLPTALPWRLLYLSILIFSHLSFCNRVRVSGCLFFPLAYSEHFTADTNVQSAALPKSGQLVNSAGRLWFGPTTSIGETFRTLIFSLSLDEPLPGTLLGPPRSFPCGALRTQYSKGGKNYNYISEQGRCVGSSDESRLLFFVSPLRPRRPPRGQFSGRGRAWDALSWCVVAGASHLLRHHRHSARRARFRAVSEMSPPRCRAPA